MSFQEVKAFSAATNTSSLASAVPTLNATSTPRDLLSLPLRGFQRAESFAFSFLPGRVARLVGLQNATTSFWSTPSTGPERNVVAAATQAAGAIGAAGAAASEAVVEAAAQPNSSLQLTDFLQAAVKFSGFFSYLTSRWSLACFTVVR
jgi:hypothetical protein